MRVVTVAVSLLLLAPIGMQASPSREVHKVVELDPNGRLSIDTHNGSVTLTTWDRPSVQIDARIEAGSDWSSGDVDRTQVRIGGSHSEVTIESDYSALEGWSANWWFGLFHGVSLPSIYYTVKMPATARLRVKDHNGDVKVTGLRSAVEISAHNGDVSLLDFDGAANIETHNGGARIAFARFASPCRLSTHNGSFRVALPQGARFNLDVDSHHGNLHSDFALAGLRGDGSRMVTTVNGGGPELRFVAHNGSLSLERH
jgi:hypothetical protein